MPVPSVQELKKAIVKAGFEVYRTRGSEIHLAERPRDNLIMDANVSILLGEPLRVRFVVRTQKADFPGDSDDTLYQRASLLGASMLEQGYAEIERRTRQLPDPGDPSRILDTWYEILFERSLPGPEEALAELPALLKLEKTAAR